MYQIIVIVITILIEAIILRASLQLIIAWTHIYTESNTYVLDKNLCVKTKKAELLKRRCKE